ncbi:hypothetical protein DKX38_005914 [Salix brachista]|uniref:Uncharacterized protein n=1 Tax=Salix brachista TaxID=2182728 RepID=A0A5N5N0X6_9ROSI|nr:hypothetical protein DKX38_005914 [Salix brachista]
MVQNLILYSLHEMKPKSRTHTETKNSNSLWKWNTNDSKKKNGIQFPVPEFLQDSCKKFEETIMGPGGGAGIGCGIGAGIGWVGGAGALIILWDSLEGQSNTIAWYPNAVKYEISKRNKQASEVMELK